MKFSRIFFRRSRRKLVAACIFSLLISLVPAPLTYAAITKVKDAAYGYIARYQGKATDEKQKYYYRLNASIPAGATATEDWYGDGWIKGMRVNIPASSKGHYTAPSEGWEKRQINLMSGIEKKYTYSYGSGSSTQTKTADLRYSRRDSMVDSDPEKNSAPRKPFQNGTTSNYDNYSVTHSYKLNYVNGVYDSGSLLTLTNPFIFGFSGVECISISSKAVDAITTFSYSNGGLSCYLDFRKLLLSHFVSAAPGGGTDRDIIGLVKYQNGYTGWDNSSGERAFHDEKKGLCIVDEENEIMDLRYAWLGRYLDLVPHTFVTHESCTLAGYRECSVCHYRENLPAAGHIWDAGKVTSAPDVYNDGVMTYTCKRDSSHHRTEAIPRKHFEIYSGTSRINKIYWGNTLVMNVASGTTSMVR